MVESGNTYRDKVSNLISWGHWFSFFNIIAAMLLGTRYLTFSGLPETALGKTYMLVNWIGHFGFLVFAIYILIIFPASFIIPSQRLMRLFAVLVATSGMTLLLLDIYAFEVLHLHLTPLVWELLLSGEKTDMNAKWQYLFVVVPIIFLLEMVLSEWVWRKLRKLSRKRVGGPIALVFGIAFISSHLIHIWADAFIYSPITSQRSTLPLSYPMTAKTLMEKYGLLDRDEYQRRREQAQANQEMMRYPIVPLEYSKTNENKYNVLMIMVNGLRADMVSPITMPQLNAFASSNVNFTRHYSSGNDGMAGVFGLFYGLPGGYAKSARTENLRPVMISSLEKQDYNFGLFSASGFDNPIYRETIFGPAAAVKKALPDSAWQSDQTQIADFEAWEKEQTSPWFSFVELDTVANYEQETDYSKPFQPSLSSKMQGVNKQASLVLKNSYNNAAYNVDKLLGDLFENLRQSGEMDKTVVIVTSNHGMEFNESGNNHWGANSAYSDYQLRVPMVIHWPGQKPQRISALTSHLDLAPTLMESLLGVTTPSKEYSSGNSLFDVVHNPQTWVMAGDSRDIVVVLNKRTLVVDKFGNYKVYDHNYQLLPNAKPPLSTLMQALHELKRFYYAEEHEFEVDS